MGQGDGSGEAGGQDPRQGQENKGLLAGGCCIIIVLVIVVPVLFGLNIAKIVMGAVYFNDCSGMKRFPIYLIVSGCCLILSELKGIHDILHADGNKREYNTCSIIEVLCLLFNFVWLICGSVWVFDDYSDVINGCGGSKDCCDTSLIRFALAVTTIDWILGGIYIVTVICVYACVCGGMFCCKNKVGSS